MFVALKQYLLLLYKKLPKHKYSTFLIRLLTIYQIYAYDIESWDRIWVVDVGAVATPGASHLCNDLVVDKHGDIYATDSFSPYIWKVHKC